MQLAVLVFEKFLKKKFGVVLDQFELPTSRDNKECCSENETHISRCRAKTVECILCKIYLHSVIFAFNQVHRGTFGRFSQKTSGFHILASK